MSDATARTPIPTPSEGRWHAFWWVAFAFAVGMMGTTLPTPLYPLYQQAIGFSELMVTIIYASYAVGVLGVLIVCGRWSDQVGRRPLLFAALALSAVSALVFLFADGLPALFIGRVLSGMSAGIFTGTATVAVVELAPQGKHATATLVATAVNMGGLGLGPILAGLLAQYQPYPLRLAFIADLVLIVIAVWGVWRAPETVQVKPSPRLGVQKLRLPPQVRGVFIPAAIAGFAGFAVLGFFTAVAPAVLGELLHNGNHAVTGALVFLIFLASMVGQVALRWMPQRYELAIGCLIQIAGVLLVGVAIAEVSLTLLALGAFIAGFGQGLAFRAGIADVEAASPPEQRAGVISAFFVVLYVAISVPVISIGVAVEMADLRTAGIGFAIGVAVVSLIALIVLVVRRAREHRNEPIKLP